MRIWLHRETWVSRNGLNIYIFNIDAKKPIKMKRLKLYVKLGKRFRWRMTFYRRQSSLSSESEKKEEITADAGRFVNLVAGS